MKSIYFLLRNLVPASLLALCTYSVCIAKDAPLSMTQLRALKVPVSVTYVRDLGRGDGYAAYLVSYYSAGLKIHAMVAQPTTAAPASGFPVLVVNHGFHPTPQRYGMTDDGVDARPGDYYRRIPSLYAKAGFLVLMPDYRGHNISEGLEYTKGLLASGYYTQDVLALLNGIHEIKHADSKNVFMWGHSLGGEVTLRTLLASGLVKGASLWSSVGGDIWDQAYYYSRYTNLVADDSNLVPKKAMQALRAQIEELGQGAEDTRSREPLEYLCDLQAPLIIHHALDDVGADYRWSMRLAKELSVRNKRYQFHTYAGSNHLFKDVEMQLAADRDIDFFRAIIRNLSTQTAVLSPAPKSAGAGICP